MSNLHLVSIPIPDAAERALALDITQSFLVEAPAGSGKTGLLIQRFLKLLASDTVDDPRQVLAITFTRKATAEMRERVLAQLTAAASGASSQTASPFEVGLHALAAAVLARDAQLGWNLLDNPARLNIRTIDSLSNEIASALPILSGSSGAQSPTDEAAPLVAEAARRTLMLLGGEDSALSDALELLLLHRDGNLANCEDLIATMLATRDQWGELVPLATHRLTDRYLDDTILPRLDAALDLAICRSLTGVSNALSPATLNRLCALAAEMGHLDGYEDNPSPIAPYAGNPTPPQAIAAHLQHWQALINLLLKKDGDFWSPKGINKRTIKFQILKHQTQQLIEIIDSIRDDSTAAILAGIRTLPPAQYPRDQWPVTKALFRVLARALTELQLVFADRGECDFTEVGLLARTALRNDSALDDLASASGARLQHLLVDEMQDTSSGQYEFIQLLTRRWDGHGQTVFLVGDPKQSIYLFRQARVERFLRTLHTQQLGDIPLTTLRLTANFRSQPDLVQSFNKDFSAIFLGAPSQSAPSIEVGSTTITYTPATAIRTGAGQRLWHPASIPHESDPASTRAYTELQADEIRQIIETWRAKPLPEGRSKPWTIAVLVRTRSALGPIITALRRPTPIPFRAVDIDTLAERPEILDLLALTRALLHPADRTAWLALLRSPVCGLSLADLHRLAGHDPERTIFQLMDIRGADLSEDGIARMESAWPVIAHALQQRGTLRLSSWVARTWRAFGIPDYLVAEALTNAEAYFQLLDQLEQPGPTLDLTRLAEKVSKLYAAPSTEPNAVDLMTLHKAKGLEWDVVLVPALHKTSRNSESQLLDWIETLPEDLIDDTIAPGILAPISNKGSGTRELNAWMRSINATRESAERKRLFYVASTRAKEELHLFATPKTNKGGDISIPADSLLKAAWPAAEPHFSAPTNLIAMPSPAQPLRLSLAAAAAARQIQRIPQLLPTLPSSLFPLPFPPFPRPEGSFSARAFGNATHAFLELLATRIASGSTIPQLLAEFPTWQSRIAAVLRGSALSPTEITRFSANILNGLNKTLKDPEGQWILAHHPEAASESALTSDEATLRLDRTFLAGPTPLSAGTTHLWIIDYKTSTHGSANLDAFLISEKAKYAPQLETYAHSLDGLHPIRLALYYPMLPNLIWWESSHQTSSPGT